MRFLSQADALKQLPSSQKPIRGALETPAGSTDDREFTRRHTHTHTHTQKTVAEGDDVKHHFLQQAYSLATSVPSDPYQLFLDLFFLCALNPTLHSLYTCKTIDDRMVISI